MAPSLGSSRPLPRGACINTLGPQAMVQAVSILGKTFDHIAFGLAGETKWSFVFYRPRSITLEAFLVSTGIVALAEIGDKTQLLAFILAAKFRKPLPIVIGILVATLANHAFAGALGSWITSLIRPETLRWVLGVSFIGMAIWTLIPDKFEEEDAKLTRFGVFGTTLVAFFLAEMGDKTQVATVALAAQYHAFFSVVAGTTLGMMIANGPAVLLGDRIAHRMPVRLVHSIAATIFAILGVATLLGAGERLGF